MHIKADGNPHFKQRPPKLCVLIFIGQLELIAALSPSTQGGFHGSSTHTCSHSILSIRHRTRFFVFNRIRHLGEMPEDCRPVEVRKLHGRWGGHSSIEGHSMTGTVQGDSCCSAANAMTRDPPLIVMNPLIC